MYHNTMPCYNYRYNCIGVRLTAMSVILVSRLGNLYGFITTSCQPSFWHDSPSSMPASMA